ncbi:MAG: hypothetical protein SNH63_07800 [Rikenellaceae bacterium]
MITYGEESHPDLQFERSEAVAVVSNLTEHDVNYHTLSRVVKKRLAPVLEQLYDEGKYYYHIGLTSRRDILVGEELVKFKKSHPKVKIILFETTFSPELSVAFDVNDLKRYRRIYNHFDIFVFHPISYGQDKNQQLNISFSKDADAIIAYDDCRSSTYLCNCNLEIRYLQTDAEMWPDEVDDLESAV